MSVHWQNSSYYKSLKDYEKESGMTLAERNALANPNGNHSTWGVLGTSLFLGLTNFGVNNLVSSVSGSQDTGSETDVPQSTSAIKAFGQAVKNYNAAVKNGNEEDIKKYAKEVVEIGDANPDNPTIKAIYTKDFSQAVKKRLS